MKLKAPENHGTHVSFDGHMYPVEKGVVEVPNSATELFNHGYALIHDEPKKETAAEKKAREKAEAEAAKSE